MTTAGEQQFYVVALMDALMEHLPPTWIVGLLYDIACQIHLSAAKYGLFGQYFERLRFAVSVFHAFGHDWPCQLVYHPRKCIGFGLTDGEGCERFWYSISKLIPYLRVAGFHLRKYTLNAQFAFATNDAIIGLAAWFSRKARRLKDKRKEAQILLEEAGEVAKDERFIRQQWQAQNVGRQELEKALELHEEVDRAAAEEADLKDEGPDDLEHEAALRSAEARHLAAKSKYDHKLAQLGLPARAQLEKLVGNKLLHRRANALVLLRRAQTGIMKRKMEVERVVRSHRNKNGENRLRKHVKTAAERREGTVKSIVAKYNRACNELLRLIKTQRKKKGHCSVRPLKPLPKADIWDLDVDNPCWDDLRFDAEDESAPPWMVDENVRKAIRGRLLLDRCEEEDRRLAHERANTLEWFESEWSALKVAARRGFAVPDAPALLHQIEEREGALLRIAVQWERHGMQVRGPSQHALSVARDQWAAASCDALPAGGLGRSPRTTRSGAAFSNVVTLPEDVNLEELFEAAERHRAEEGEDADVESILTSLPSSRASSPLSDLTEDEGNDPGDANDGEQEGDAGVPDAAPAVPPAARNSKARKSQAQRKHKRQENGNTSDASKRHRADKILDAFQEPVSYNFGKAPITSTGFTCLRNAWESGIPALEDLVGYKLLDWDGLASGAVTANEEQVVLAMMVGIGKGKEKDHVKIAKAIRTGAGRMTFSAEEREHRRGLFSVKGVGISHGGGQKEPGLLKHSDKNARELQRIVKLKPMQDLAHLNSTAFGNWQPEIYDEYAKTKKKLLEWKPRMRRFLNFKKSVWSCLTINFGPRTQCCPHRDFNNLSYGFCAITALGDFDPDRGGHLILRELKLVIRFPPGASIIVPSALITHYNAHIGQGETRYSVTQYTSGAIFRFVEHGLKLDADYYASLNAAGRRQAAAANTARWRKGLAKLSRLPKLRRAAENARGGGHAGVEGVD
ncbi:hypothetical protein GGF50DRAFT_67357 [Schizophyllum commune]